MIIMLYVSLMIMMLSMMLILVAMNIPVKYQNMLEKSTPFECGFNPKEHSRMPFSLHFFLIAIIFLIFDVEVALLLPFNITLNNIMPLGWFMSTTLFILILLLGLMLEWKEGILQWTK
uniref:NADH-ubiquinone oxidoreductase chain 3 n=1 Tax=Xibalbanus tulumensis TaxID=1519145 RepID=Q6SKY6_XIBTU|nr:NADH dehydrogenase subunit 3 [Xibalbanus tulumensis]AAS00887.1 NADH dehydrogenase subunit 3 [Xibalbanus tulumensis]